MSVPALAAFPLAALGIVALAAPAVADAPACGSRPEILAQLEKHYSESPVAMGLDSRGRVLEVLTSPDSGTWTILVTSPDGVTCLVDAGTAFEHLVQPINDPVA